MIFFWISRRFTVIVLTRGHGYSLTRDELDAIRAALPVATLRRVNELSKVAGKSATEMIDEMVRAVDRLNKVKRENGKEDKPADDDDLRAVVEDPFIRSIYRELLSAMGRLRHRHDPSLGGPERSLGGKNRMAGMTPLQRKEMGRKGARQKWGNRRLSDESDAQ